MAAQSFQPSASEPSRLIASPLHTLFLVIIEALNAYRATIFAAHVRAGLVPNRPFLYLRTMLFEFLILAIVIVGVRFRGASLQTIFGQRWRSFGQMFTDLGLGVALLFASTLLVSVLSGHQSGAPPDQSIAYLIPQTPFELLLWMALSFTAGICEETVYRGYFQRQFAALTHNVPAGILLSAAAFAAGHAYQGFQRSFVIGVAAVLSGMFAHWRGTVRPGMFAHTIQDAVAPLLIKWMRH